MKNLIQSASYQNLEHYIQKLLGKSENGFENKSEYILFLAYLIVSDDYKKRIETVDTSLQLLLNEPEKFWLAPFGEASHQEIKRDLIKSIILNKLELYIQKHRNSLQNLSQIDSFIQTQNNQFEKRFEGQEFSTIFSHNMDFSLPRNHPPIIFRD